MPVIFVPPWKNRPKKHAPIQVTNIGGEPSNAWVTLPDEPPEEDPMAPYRTFYGHHLVNWGVQSGELFWRFWRTGDFARMLHNMVREVVLVQPSGYNSYDPDYSLQFTSQEDYFSCTAAYQQTKLGVEFVVQPKNSSFAQSDDEFKKWFPENAKHRYRHNLNSSRRIVFENEDDALLFKLRWSDLLE